MNPSFFGLEGHPFACDAQSPDSGDGRFLDAYGSLVTELEAGLKAPHGITLVIGEAGAGKTRLMKGFADARRDTCAIAFLPSSGPGLRHLLTESIEQLGGSAPPAGDETALLESLRSLGRAHAEHERVTLVVIDDAHELPAKTIERIGKLFGDDPAEPTRLHVVLVGRSELLDRMNAANDRSILKHLVQVCRVDAIGPEDSFRYIAGRVAKVGGVVDDLFTPEALRVIVHRAGGNPARIDDICSAALERAERGGDAPVDVQTVELACSGAGPGAADVTDDSAAVPGTAVAPRRPSNGADTEPDGEPPAYVFGEEDGDDGDDPSEPPRRRRKRRSGTRHADAAKSAGTMARLRELYQRRRSLFLAAGGLIAVLFAFAMTMESTAPRSAIDDIALRTPAAEPVRVAPKPPAAAAKSGGERGDRSDAADARAATGGGEEARSVLPSKPVSAPKLIVRRTPRASTAAAVTPAAPATPRAAPARVDARPANRSEVPATKPAATGRQPRTPSRPVTPVSPAQVARPNAPAPAAAPPPRFGPPVAFAPPAAQPAPASTAEPAAAAPAPAAPAAPATPATRETPVVAQPTPTPKPAPIVARAPASTSVAAASVRRYTVQLGAFKARANAQALLDKADSGFDDGQIIEAPFAGGHVYRVLSGNFASKAEADGRAVTLKEKGFATYVRTFTP